MKVAITGHTSGIGQAVFNCIGNCTGFSRSNGCDIKDYNRIAFLARNHNVFINNAHSGFNQVYLLYAVFRMWKDLPCTIINISSDAPEQSIHRENVYAIEKLALDTAARQLSSISTTCKVKLIKFPYVDTPRVSHISEKKLPVNKAAQIVIDMITSDQLEKVIYASV